MHVKIAWKWSIRAHLDCVTQPRNIRQTHDSLITFNNGLGPLKTKSGGGVLGLGFGGGGSVGWGFSSRTVV